MKKFTLSSLLFLFAFALVSTTFTSCGDDDPETVMGCTDEDADNYNAEATADDGMCAYVNRFVGVYDGAFSCPMLTQFESAVVTISESPGSTTTLAFTIMTGEAGTPTALTIPMSATIVDKNTITVVVSLPMQDLSANSIFAGAGPDARWDVDVNGTLALTADNDLDGNVIINIAEVALGTGIILADDCGFTAVRR